MSIHYELIKTLQNVIHINKRLCKDPENRLSVNGIPHAALCTCLPEETQTSGTFAFFIMMLHAHTNTYSWASWYTCDDVCTWAVVTMKAGWRVHVQQSLGRLNGLVMNGDLNWKKKGANLNHMLLLYI